MFPSVLRFYILKFVKAMSFGTQKRFSPKAKDLELLREHQEEQERLKVHSRSNEQVRRRRQREESLADSPPSSRESDFHVTSGTGPPEVKPGGTIELDPQKVSKAAKLLSEPVAVGNRSNFRFDPTASESPYRGLHRAGSENPRKKLEREGRQYRRRLDLLQSQTLEKASVVQRLQTEIDEMQTGAGPPRHLTLALALTLTSNPNPDRCRTCNPSHSHSP